MPVGIENREPLGRLQQGARIAIVRLRSMGDCVLTTPALDLLHRARPDLNIGVVVEDRFAGVFEDNPAVARLVTPDYAAILRWRPALCLNLHGGTRSMLLTLASLAPVRSGFAHHRGAAVYNVRIPRAQQILGVERTVHTAEHLASAMFYLGVPPAEIPRARVFAGNSGAAARPYAVIHAAAAAAYKTWPAERFLAVAEHIEREHGLEPVFVGAAEDDLGRFSRYRLVAGAPLREVKALLAGATLFAGNDSGPAHLACALGVPVVVLFGRPEHQIIWAPWRPAAARSLASPEGIAGITTREVIAAVDALSRGI